MDSSDKDVFVRGACSFLLMGSYRGIEHPKGEGEKNTRRGVELCWFFVVSFS